MQQVNPNSDDHSIQVYYIPQGFTQDQILGFFTCQGFKVAKCKFVQHEKENVVVISLQFGTKEEADRLM